MTPDGNSNPQEQKGTSKKGNIQNLKLCIFSSCSFLEFSRRKNI